MKSFTKYLMESVRSYDYTIKILGEPDKTWLELFCYNLDSKFDAVEMSDPTTTVTQRNPLGFPENSNKPVTIIKAKFRYPTTEIMIKDIVRLLVHDKNSISQNDIRVFQSGYEDSINAEMKQYENQIEHTPVLNHAELEDNGKEASKDYAGSYLDKIRAEYKKNPVEMSYATGKPKNSFDPFKAVPKQISDITSPISHISRPPKPKTSNNR